MRLKRYTGKESAKDMQIIIVDKEKLETYLADRFGDKLQTGNKQKNGAEDYIWGKRSKYLHDNKGAKGVTI